MRSASATRVRASAPIQPRWPAMTSRATASCRSASSMEWRTWSSGGMWRAALSRAVAIAASRPVLAVRSLVRSANGSVFAPAGGSAARASSSAATAVATAGTAGADAPR